MLTSDDEAEDDEVDEEENRLIDIHQVDVDEVNIKRTIPGKKIRSVEVIAKIVSDNQSQK